MPTSPAFPLSSSSSHEPPSPFVQVLSGINSDLPHFPLPGQFPVHSSDLNTKTVSIEKLLPDMCSYSCLFFSFLAFIVICHYVSLWWDRKILRGMKPCLFLSPLNAQNPQHLGVKCLESLFSVDSKYASLVHTFYFHEILRHCAICLGLKDEGNRVFYNVCLSTQYRNKRSSKNSCFLKWKWVFSDCLETPLLPVPECVSSKKTCWQGFCFNSANVRGHIICQTLCRL